MIVKSDILLKQRVSSCKKFESAISGERSALSALEMDLITENKNEQSTVNSQDTALCFASGKVRKSAKLAFRMTIADYEELKKLAAKNDLLISDWLRDAALNSIRQQKTSQAA